MKFERPIMVPEDIVTTASLVPANEIPQAKDLNLEGIYAIGKNASGKIVGIVKAKLNFDEACSYDASRPSMDVEAEKLFGLKI